MGYRMGPEWDFERANSEISILLTISAPQTPRKTGAFVPEYALYGLPTGSLRSLRWGVKAGLDRECRSR
jgi:hypothetical protein